MLVNKENIKEIILRTLSFIIGLIGLYVILKSPISGQNSTDFSLLSATSGIDKTQYITILESHIAAYRWVGSILLAVGAYGSLRK